MGKKRIRRCKQNGKQLNPINPHVTNGLSRHHDLDEFTFTLRGVGIDSFFDEIHVSKQNSPR